MRSVFLAMPAHGSYVHASTTNSIGGTIYAMQQQGIPLLLGGWLGDSLLPNARNILIAKFLETDCTDMVFVDSDISWQPETFVRLINHDVEFVAGIYRTKREVVHYPVNFLDNPQPQNGPLIEVADVPMGFTKLSRLACLKLMDAYRSRSYKSAASGDLPLVALFDVPFVPNLGLHGEDYGFCKRWRDIGGKVWVDPDMTLTHHGDFGFTGHLGNWLESQRPKEKA